MIPARNVVHNDRVKSHPWYERALKQSHIKYLAEQIRLGREMELTPKEKEDVQIYFLEHRK